MTDVPVRIRMNETADGLEEGTEWFGYRDSSGWFSVDKTQGEGPQRNWRCIMPQEAVVVVEMEYLAPDGEAGLGGPPAQTTQERLDAIGMVYPESVKDQGDDYGPDGYPYPRPARWIRTSPLNPDMADMADPPDKEDR